MTLAIVTDSTANISKETAHELGVHVIPLTLTFGEQSLLDMKDITEIEFFDRLLTDPNHPKTSQPSVGAFINLYKELIANGVTEILSIHISKKLSGTFESATQAASQVKNCTVEVLDTGGVSLPLGFAVIEAAKNLKNGASINELKEIIENQMNRTKVFVGLNTLEYLIKGGRMSKAKGFIGTKLNFKPIITLNNGLIESAGKARNFNKTIDSMIKMATELAPFEYIGVMHGNSLDLAQEVANKLIAIDKNSIPMIRQLSPVLGVHAGPGSIGITAVSSKK